MNESRLTLRIYLEDTDAQGVVYHANYLKFFERARSELLASLGVDQTAWLQRVRFVVHELSLRFRRPARLGDTITVVTSFEVASEYRLTFFQRAQDENGQLLVEGRVEVVCTDGSGNLIEVPAQVRPSA
jgi:tol-pal system-associated acyl-CoA thioesterase